MNKTPKRVYILGSFTSPPWEKKVDLDYCPLRGIFVKYMNNLSGRYLFNQVCLLMANSNVTQIFTMATDASGHAE